MINRLSAVLAWLLVAAIAFVTLSPINLRPQTGHVFLERFLSFVALGATFGVGYPRRMPLAAAFTLLASVALEAAQLLIPGRHARMIDAAEKLAGGLTGLMIAAAFLLMLERAQASRAS